MRTALLTCWAALVPAVAWAAPEEAPLHANLKQAIVQSNGHDTVLTEIPDIAAGRVWPGAMARTLRNRFVSETAPAAT